MNDRLLDARLRQPAPDANPPRELANRIIQSLPASTRARSVGRKHPIAWLTAAAAAAAAAVVLALFSINSIFMVPSNFHSTHSPANTSPLSDEPQQNTSSKRDLTSGEPEAPSVPSLPDITTPARLANQNPLAQEGRALRASATRTTRFLLSHFPSPPPPRSGPRS